MTGLLAQMVRDGSKWLQMAQLGTVWQAASRMVSGFVDKGSSGRGVENPGKFPGMPHLFTHLVHRQFVSAGPPVRAARTFVNSRPNFGPFCELPELFLTSGRVSG